MLECLTIAKTELSYPKNCGGIGINGFHIKNPGDHFGTMYQLNSTANPVHLPPILAKLAKSSVLFSWLDLKWPLGF